MTRPSALVFPLLVSIALAHARPTGALELSLSALEATPEESERAAIDSLLSAGQWEEAAGLAGRRLEVEPRDGFALRALVLCARDEGRLVEFVRAVESRAPSAWPGTATLGRAERSFVLGLADYYTDRMVRAEERLTEAQGTAPEWNWPRMYRGRARRENLLPRSAWESDLEAAARDPDTAPHLWGYLARLGPTAVLSAEQAAAREAMEGGRVPSWLRRGWQTRLAWERLYEPGVDRESAEEIWRGVQQSRGLAVLDQIHSFGRRIGRLTPPDEIQELGTNGARSSREEVLWGLVRAERLVSLGRDREATALLDGAPAWYGLRDECLLMARQNHDDPASLLALVRRATRTDIDASVLQIVHRFRQAAPGTGWDGLADSLEAECPRAALEVRLRRLIDRDFRAARALLDSLENAGSDLGLLDDERAAVFEQSADTLRVDAMLDRPPVAARAGLCCSVARAAASRGDRGRAIRLARRAAALDPHNASILQEALAVARALRDRELANELTDALLAACPSCAGGLDAAIRALAVCGDTERAAELLRRAARLPALGTAAGLSLSADAAWFGMDERADSLLEVARQSEPESRQVAYARALRLVDQRRLDAARELAQGLLRQLPADEDYRNLMFRAGGQVALAAAQGSEDPFRVLGHDLESTGWILAAAAEAETTRTADAVVLEQRTSVLGDRGDGALVRTRKTVLILNEGGLRSFQPFRIRYSASDPAPQVRVARVIRRDGTVVEVPRGDILVTAPEDENADVGESRGLAVPFAGLEPGAVLDLCYDRLTSEPDRNGWSLRVLLGDAWPVRRACVELLQPSSTPVAYHATPGAGVPRVTTAEGEQLRTWEVTQLAAIAWDPLGGNLFDRTDWVGFSRYPSWESGLEGLRRTYRDLIRPEAMRELAARITSQARGDRQKCEALYRHVVESVRYLAIELDRGRVVPTPPQEVLARGYGDCKDMTVLLASLLEAAGLAAEPLLISTAEARQPIQSLPEPYLFNHVIVFVPGVGDGIYCDPTTGDPCLGPPPPNLSGASGIRLTRHGPVAWARVPESRPEEHGFDLVADLYPRQDGRATIEARAAYRGQMATDFRRFLASTDSAGAVTQVSDNLGYGLWDTCRLTGWKRAGDDCAELVLSAGFEDTSWVEAGQNSVRFRWTTEVADPVLYYPSGDDRTQAVRLPFPFRCTAKLRLHRAAAWRTEPRLASARVEGEGFRGRIEIGEGRSGEDSWVEVRQQFELERARLTAEEYRRFRDEWIRFLFTVHQPYTYYRALPEAELAELEAYIRDKPDDSVFAFQAAARVLGEDLGGDGETGRARREVARRWLSAAVADPEAGVFPHLVLAGLEAKEGRYRRADSLLAGAQARDPSNSLLASFLASLKRELGQTDEQIRFLQSVLKRTGSASTQIELVTALHAAGRETEAEEGERRLLLLGSGGDSTQILVARHHAYVASERMEAARQNLELLRGRVESKTFDLLESEVCLHTRRWDEARGILERLWKENPLDAFLCNNLAWTYAVLGIELARAEDLANSAVILSADPSASRNTLGAIYARQGKWDRARGLFQEALVSDDRPAHAAANEFFLGLCDYQDGRRDEALACWRRLQSLPGGRQACVWARDALELHDRGEPVSLAVFSSPVGEQK